MTLIPFKKIIFYSELNEQELIFKLQEHVSKTYNLYNSNQDSLQSYFGIIRPPSFSMYRMSKGRNSFIPQLHGKIEKQKTGSKINISMQLHPVVLMIFLFVVCFFGYGIFKSQEIVSPPLIIIILVYIMTIYFFNDECKKAVTDLQTILEAAIIH